MICVRIWSVIYFKICDLVQDPVWLGVSTLARLAVNSTHSNSSPILCRNSSTYGLFRTYTCKRQKKMRKQSHLHDHHFKASASLRADALFPLFAAHGHFLKQVIENGPSQCEPAYPGLLEPGRGPRRTVDQNLDSRDY